ncbi:hypothetical protein NSE01_14410 [Novosphingobium sediminis]|uniref:DUF192 domain-containing protein n=1 Tax=Novosphingobium sediminis TaxID=707214 RepID=A0A512AIS3_9SPHN|nr:DUF192 domain-containing protein [Novosphingobium sediminis]GEN99608.1 hypothetical protein NSE01_14410 [Novosphingobium sediminis]
MPKTIWNRAASLALLIAAVGCSPLGAGSTSAQGAATTAPAAQPAMQSGVHPVSGLTVVPLTVTTANGPHTFKVEVAASPAEQERGLMFRTTMGADEGMIFPMDPPRPAAFWMKNTVIPLDIIFVGADHKVLNIAANAVPYDLSPLPSFGNAAGVLELNGGRAAQIGLKPGDTVSW